jgi:ubiquinone/menaquinone biosynthesis C-methylase UbiE
MDDKNFLNLFVCTVCHAKLALSRKGSNLKCPQCHRKFPVNDGIVDAFVPVEGLSIATKELVARYEHWGEFVSRGKGKGAKQRRDITMSLVEGNLLLEIGCAEGFMTSELAGKVPHVIASDISLSYLRRAKARASCARFARLDIHNIPFDDDTFDCIVCAEVLEHTLSPFKALNEMHRVLRPGGSLVISVPNGMTLPRVFIHVFRRKKSMLSYTNAHLNFYDTGSLLQILEIAGFTPKLITTHHVPFPGLRSLGYRLALKYLPFMGEITIVKATKKGIDYWEKLGRVVESRKGKLST